MLKIEIDSKRYSDGKPIISGLNIELEQGERVAIVAPSGAGKSTLMRILAGIDRGYTGKLSASSGSQDKGNWPAAGVMFQDARLLPWLTIEENLVLVTPGLPVSEAKARAARLLQSVGLESVAGRYPGALSGGMQRRVALARALMPRRGLLLLDEPLVSLDLPSVERLRDLILAHCRDDGLTLVYVTHDIEEAIRVADRIMFLSRSPAALIHQEVVAKNIHCNQSLIDEKLKKIRAMKDVMEGRLPCLAL